MRLKAKVEKEVEIGFQCDVCDVKYSSGYNAHIAPKEWPQSNIANLSFDHPDGEYETCDMCSKCYDLMKGVIIAMGGKTKDV